jgi:hypothetical protein
MKFGLWIAIAYVLFSGCTVNYSLEYDTTLKHNETSGNNDLDFKFTPLYNGVMFTIVNNSDETARILWDKSYFIMPNGNSSKALNPDLLREEKEIVDKSSNVSTVPSRSEFSRFTTSTLNATKFAFANISSFYTRIGSYESSSIRILNDEFVRSENYWPYQVVVDMGSAMNDSTKTQVAIRGLETISNFVEMNNHLGVGFVIEQSGKEEEYRFDILIDKVHAIRKVSESSSEGKSTRVYYLLDFTYSTESKQWIKVGREIPN